jgi:hypothetical protein
MSRRRAVTVLASSAALVVLAMAGIVYAGSLGPAPATTSLKRIAWLAPTAASTSSSQVAAPQSPRIVVTKPINAPPPQAPPRSCQALVLRSFGATSSLPRQFTVSWSATGGCAQFDRQFSWFGSGIAGGSNTTLATTASDSKTFLIYAPGCTQNEPANTLVTINFTMQDSVAHRVYSQTQVGVQLC